MASRDDALAVGDGVTDRFRTTLEFRAPTNDELAHPKTADTKTKVEPPSLSPNGSAFPDYGKQPESKIEPKAATNNGQTSAPKSCGEIKDQQTLIAMGCVSQPGARPAVANPTPPVVTRAANRSREDCFSDAVCAEELRADELRGAERQRELERQSDPRRNTTGYPPAGVGRGYPGSEPGYPGISPGYPTGGRGIIP